MIPNGANREFDQRRRPLPANRRSVLAPAPKTPRLLTFGVAAVSPTLQGTQALGRFWRGAPEGQSFQKFLNRPGASAV